ncbi:MAG: hypothetical protein ACOCWG_04415, partial [bacterium]
MSSNREDSINTAKVYAPKEIEEFAKVTSSVIKNKRDIPQTWVQNIPYSSQGVKNEIKTCGQLIEEIIQDQSSDNKNNKKLITNGEIKNHNSDQKENTMDSNEI